MSEKSGFKHFFVSYAHADGEFVKRLVTDLKKRGIPIWVDTEELEPGIINWGIAIRKAVGESIALIFIASPDASQSSYVQAELAIAKSVYGKIIIGPSDGS
jgi:DNA-binding IclR family transcriptional regulator